MLYTLAHALWVYLWLQAAMGSREVPYYIVEVLNLQLHCTGSPKYL